MSLLILHIINFSTLNIRNILVILTSYSAVILTISGSDLTYISQIRIEFLKPSYTCRKVNLVLVE